MSEQPQQHPNTSGHCRALSAKNTVPLDFSPLILPSKLIFISVSVPQSSILILIMHIAQEEGLTAQMRLT
jgi:hypothetical protein